MEKTSKKQGIKALMLCFALFLLCFKVEAYKNYTVGDSLGWFDKLEKPDVDYDKWVDGKIFSLGDFLLFNTDNNHSIIQTHNSNTYKSCDSQEENNILWSVIEPNSTSVQSVTVAVPLLKEGPTYFFSGDYDGEQCMNGQKLQINVTHGQGLPSSLKDNPDIASGPTSGSPAPGPTDPDSGDEQSVPDTMVPANFDHPKNIPDEEESDDTKKSNGVGDLPLKRRLLGAFVSGLLVLFLNLLV